MKNLFRFSVFSACAGLILIIAGGLVTSHQAGLSVPDWPLSYGKWMPPMVGKIFWEHGHRMIATFVGLLTLIMSVWTHFIPGASPRLKSFSRLLVELVILQGVFGGLTVLYNLPPAVSIMHACLGQVFFASLVLFAYAVNCEAEPLARFFDDNQKQMLAKAFRITRATVIVLLVQLLLGAATRHIRHLHIAWTHVVFALVVTLHIVLIYLRAAQLDSEDKPPRQIALFLLNIIFLQILLGAGSLGFTQFLARHYEPTSISVWFTTFHQSLGAVLFVSTVTLGAMFYKRLKLASAGKL